MDRTKSKRKKELYSLILVLVLVGITIGYAALSTNLNINGTSRVSGNSWDIHFESIKVTSGSVTTTSPDQAATISSGDTEVTYIVTLNKPGDFYEFTVDAVNEGTVDGMIGAITSKLNNVVIDNEHPLPVYFSYSITYLDDVPLEINHLLAAGTSETYKVRLEFKKDIENNQLPSTDVSSNLSFSVDYVQKTDSAIVIPHRETVYSGAYYQYVCSYNPNGFVWPGEELPAFVTPYATPAPAISDIQSHFYDDNYRGFIKYILVNDKVSETYLGYEITDALHALKPNTKVGTFYIKGGDEGASYEENKAILNNALGQSSCTEDTSIITLRSYNCIILNDISTSIREDGYIYINNSGFFCYIQPDGSSICGEMCI